MSITKFFKKMISKSDHSFCEPKYLTALPAPTENDFPLRKVQEEKLFQALQQQGSHILLHGNGGTGKTHMARKLFYRLRPYYKYMAWVEYGKDIRSALAVGLSDDVTGNMDVRLNHAIRKLAEHAEETILFIDDAKEGANSDTALSQITGMPITILMTSRCPSISPYEVHRLEQPSLQECTELFCANYAYRLNREQQKGVQTLVEHLERNVFAILLFARVAGKPKSLQQIIDRMVPGTLSEHIGQLVEQGDLTQEERKILWYLSLMPSGEILEELLGWFDFPLSCINNLEEKGWLSRNKEIKTVILHDLIREYYSKQSLSTEVASTFVKAALGDDFRRGAVPQATPLLKRKVLEFQVRALEVMKSTPGKTDEALACAYNCVGMEFSQFGSHRKALEYKLKALEISEKVLPPEHPDLALSYNNVGFTYGELGDHKKELEYQLKALEIREKVLPPEHPGLTQSYNNVGGTYGALGDHKKALEYQLKALEIREKVLPPEHPDLAISYNNVGSTYGDLGDHKKALEYQLKALEIWEKVLPPEHPDLALSYNNVGGAYGALGDHKKALKYRLKALEISEKVLPPEHPDLALSYNNVGFTYGELGDHKKELEYQLKALEIREKVLPPEHPDLAQSHNNVGFAYGDLGDHKKALEHIVVALRIAKKSLPPEHPTLLVIQDNLEFIEKEIDK